MKILYISALRDFSGYAQASRNYVKALDLAGADVITRAVKYDVADPGTEYVPTEREKELSRKSLGGEAPDIVIQHVTPNEMRLPTFNTFNVAMCAWETDRIPAYWVEKLKGYPPIHLS
jgi:hypothetical protein